MNTQPKSSVVRWTVRLVALVVILVAGWVLGLAIREQRIYAMHEVARTAAQRTPSAAPAAFQRYLEFAPNDQTARLELAIALKQTDPDRALDVLRSIPTTAREYVAAAWQAAVINLELGRDDDARGPLLLLAEKRPDDARVQLTLGEIAYRARDFDAAVDYAAKCRALDPQNVAACLLQAEALDDAQRSEEMIEPLETALRLQPELPQAHLNLAYAQHLVGEYGKAMEHLRWFLARYPQSAPAHRILAQVERGRGNMEAALSAAKKAREAQPNNLDAALIEAELLLFLHRPQEAYEQLAPLASRFGGDRRFLALASRTAAMSGHREEAAKYQSRLQQLNRAE